jgi:transglutaminase-like putative cysteine protease
VLPPTASPSAAIEKFHEASLLGMLAAGYFALAASLDWATAAITFAALIIRVLMAMGIVRFELAPMAVLILALAGIAFYPLDGQFISQSFLAATVHLACLLAVIKILSARKRSDFVWVRLIALLELPAAALVSASPSFFAFLGLYILCAIAAYASSEVLSQMNPPPEARRRSIARGSVRSVPRRLAVFSGALFTGILVMTAGMFFVLPRTARAALERFAPPRYHLPGFSSQVSLGEIGEIKRVGVPVMHIRSFGEAVLPPLYWRGASLSFFDGRTWSNPPAEEKTLNVERGLLTFPERAGPRPGRRIQYRVQYSDIAPDTLFFAGNPLTISINLPMLRQSEGGALRIPRSAVTGLRYGVYAILESGPRSIGAPIETLSDVARRDYLNLPPLDRRIYRLAREFAAGAATQEDEARSIERRLKQDYTYTLELPSPPGPDPLSHFLFERRKGHCEYFASAMAVMLRAVGIPSRVATGFLNGAYNPVTGWQVIRTSDAHSWVEAWIDGRGWTTFDPTPPDPGAAASGTLSGLSLMADAVGQFWQDWVLSYDIERQLLLASRIEQSGRRMRFDWLERAGRRLENAAKGSTTLLVWLGVLVVVTIVLALYGDSLRSGIGRWQRLRRVQRGEAQASDATLLYERMLDALERRGFRKPPWITPVEFVGMLPPSPMSRIVEGLTSAYNECRFGGRPEAASTMLHLLEQIERG